MNTRLAWALIGTALALAACGAGTQTEDTTPAQVDTIGKEVAKPKQVEQPQPTQDPAAAKRLDEMSDEILRQGDPVPPGRSLKGFDP